MSEDGCGKSLGIDGAAAFIDVETVRLVGDGHHLGAKITKRVGRGSIGRPVGAIDNNLHAIKTDIRRQRRFREFHIAPDGVQHPAGTAEQFRLGQLDGPGCQLGNAELDGIIKLEPIRAEQLDAIIVMRVVACRNHHPEMGAKRACQIGDARCRHRPEQAAVHADGGESCNKRRFHHIAGHSGVLADHDKRPSGPVFRVVVDEPAAGRQRQADNRLGGHCPGIDPCAHPVGTEHSCHAKTCVCWSSVTVPQ